MASNTFIKFEGIKGSSANSKHKDEIEVMSWNHGFSQPPPSRNAASGRTVEQAQHMDFSFTKDLDASTDDLIKLCWTGKHVDKVRFTAYRSGGQRNTRVAYLKIVMTDVVVSNYSVGGGPEDLPVENVSLSYASVEYIYTGTSKKGKASSKQAVKHDLTTRKIS